MAAPKIIQSLWQNQAPGITNYGALEEGGYLVGGTPTPGTGVSYSITTSFSDTTPFLYIYNPGNAGVSMYMDYIKIICTIAPASTTSMQYSLSLDKVARAITTNHVTAAVFGNPNGGLAPVGAPTLSYQSSATASVIAASSAAAIVAGRGSLGGLCIAGDEIDLCFGQTFSQTSAQTAVEGAGQGGSRTFFTNGVIIPPLGSLCLNVWLVGNAATALSYELVVGAFLR